MNRNRKERRQSQGSRLRVFCVEILEERALLTATETFSGPSLAGLIQLARHGVDTAPAAINTMVQALQSQLDSGPLADLNAGTVNGNGFVAEVQSLESSFEQNVAGQIGAEFPNVNAMLDLQGQRIVADVISLNQQQTVGVLSSADFAAQAQTAINSLTGGPILALGTPLSAYVSTTQTFESNLHTLAQSLSTTATPALTPAQVSSTVTTEAEAYRSDLDAALQVTHPLISNEVDTAVNALESTANAIASETNANAQAQLQSAITTFDDAILDTTGLFGPQGIISRALAHGVSLAPNPTTHRAATSVGSVSGTATSGGTATLTATLTSAVTNQGIASQTIVFTLDGAFAGTAVTNSTGVATLSNVATTDSVGTDSGGVVASFAGNINNASSHGCGDLIVS